MSAELKVYRFNFRPEFVAMVYKFSHIHQYDSCADFKEAFTKWEETNEAVITAETQYLEGIGYIGDFRTKVFKSARYYFRKKSSGELILDLDGLDGGEGGCEEKGDVTKPKQKKSGARKRYTSIDYDLATKITEYLEEFHGLKPSDGFNGFYELYRHEVDAEVLRLEVDGDCEAGSGILKIKKTFKNKHFNKKRELLQRRDVNIESGLA